MDKKSIVKKRLMHIKIIPLWLK